MIPAYRRSVAIHLLDIAASTPNMTLAEIAEAAYGIVRPDAVQLARAAWTASLGCGNARESRAAGAQLLREGWRPR